MRKYFLVTLLCVASFTLFAQVALRDTATGNFIAGYAGIVFASGYQIDTAQTTVGGNIRVGASWKLNLSTSKKLSFTGWGFYQTGITNPVLSYRLRYQFTKKLWLQFGETQSAGAWVLRPNPASQGGQFEVTPQVMIPGKGLGALGGYESGKIKVLASTLRRENRYWDYQLLVQNGKFTVLAMVQADTVTRYTASVQMDTKPLTLIATANQQKLGGFVGLPLGNAGCRAFCDIGYGWDKRSWAIEPGFVQNWKIGVLRIKGAVTYSERFDEKSGRKRALNVYVLATL